MNDLINEIQKNQYLRYINGNVINHKKDKQEYLVSNGYPTVNLSKFKSYMKNLGINL